MASTTSFGNGNRGFQASIIHGSVNTTFYLPPERPETPPRPSIVIPFDRDAHFIERGVILQQINQRCAAPRSRVALVGLGGVGKSQLAIEHAYRTREQFSETWVFWVHASNAARFEQSYRDIADRVKIYGRRDPKANIFKLVRDWLHNCRERWLLVLDNLDDARFLVDGQSNSQGQDADSRSAPGPLRDYLPYCERGSVLITTRNKEAALKLAEQRDVVIVEPMDHVEARALFEKKLEAQGDSTSIDELAATLEYMPLAIVQAAAYISQRAPRYSVRQYLDEFKKSERKRTSLLNRDEGQLRRDWEAKNSIIVTWEISFQYIHHTRPSAADLLSLMSFFDRQGIPEELLRRRTQQTDAQSDQQGQQGNDIEGEKDDNTSWSSINDDNFDSDEDDVSESSTVDDGFEDDIVALRNFCLVSVETGGKSFGIHALVQLATRRWLGANGTLERWKQQFIGNLYAAFPTGDHENWATCQALFAHAKSAAGQRPEGGSSLVEWTELLYRAAWYAEEIGNIIDAEQLAVASMKVRRKILGPEHTDTLWSLAMAGSAYRNRGRWDDAKKLEVQVMETRKRVLGAEHPDTLTSMANLASTLSDQGWWKEAEELEVQVVEMRKRVLGAEHPYTLTSMNNLASTFWHQGRWKEAEELEVQVMETRKRVLNAEHPDTLTSMSSLGSTYRNQGRWKEAEELEVQVMETRKRVFGAEHTDTLTSIASLASTYRSQGRWKEAEELEVQAMETRKRVFGAEHPGTLTSMANLASTLWHQKRWKEAEELDVQVMETRKRVLGVEHPETLTSMNNVASTYRSQRRRKEAEELEVQVMETRKRTLGAEHPETLTSMANLASTYRSQERWKEAEELDVQVMETRKRVLGAEHPSTLASMNNLSHTLEGEGRTAEAILLMEMLLEVGVKVFGPQHPNILAASKNLDKWRQKGP